MSMEQIEFALARDMGPFGALNFFFLSSAFQDSVFRYGSPSEIMTALQ